MQTELIRLKKAARRSIRQQIRMLDEKELEKSDEAIYNNLSALPELTKAKRVFLYCSAGREVDTHRLLALCLSRGQTAALPVTLPDGEMYFAACAPAALTAGRFFGILEPPADAAPIEPAAGDVIVVPALTYDRQGYRLGQGGGYYDRFLSRHSLYAVGVARTSLLCDAVPRERHDMRVNCLVTEGGVFRFMGQ